MKEQVAGRKHCPVMDVAFLQGRSPAALLRTSFTPIGRDWAATLLTRVPLSHNVIAAALALRCIFMADRLLSNPGELPMRHAYDCTEAEFEIRWVEIQMTSEKG